MSRVITWVVLVKARWHEAPKAGCWPDCAKFFSHKPFSFSWWPIRESRARGAWATGVAELRAVPAQGGSGGAARGSRARRECAVRESQERLNFGAAALMREANENSSGARARQEL